jgi:hypothetical protein
MMDQNPKFFGWNGELNTPLLIFVCSVYDSFLKTKMIWWH